MRVSFSHEVKLAKYRFASHDHVRCAGCGAIVSGPHQATDYAIGKGHWRRQCSACGIVTRYDVTAYAFEGRVDGQWLMSHAGTQDTSNYLSTREAAEAELPRLAVLLGCDVSDLRVVEVAS